MTPERDQDYLQLQRELAALQVENERLVSVCKMMLRWIEQNNFDDPEVEHLTLQTVAEHVEAAVNRAMA